MTPDLQRLLQSENLCYITTYDTAGKPGTVEIWFVYEQGKLYISTGAGSVKVKKLRVTPRARVAIGRWKGPAVEGPARLVDEATVRRMVPVLSKKYNDYWGPVDTFPSPSPSPSGRGDMGTSSPLALPRFHWYGWFWLAAGA